MPRVYVVHDISMYRFHIKVKVQDLVSGRSRGIFLSLFDKPKDNGSILKLTDLADNLRLAADWVERIAELPMDQWGVGIGRLVKDQVEDDDESD